MMDFLNKFLDFLLTYYKFIALGFSVLIFILDLIILGVRNRQPLLTVYSKIREWIPGVIRLAEETSYKGEDKLSFAVSTINDLLVKTFPKISPDKYERFVISCIEDVLTTPQKKGD